jgi:hypothetical protein
VYCFHLHGETVSYARNEQESGASTWKRLKKTMKGLEGIQAEPAEATSFLSKGQHCCVKLASEKIARQFSFYANFIYSVAKWYK